MIHPSTILGINPHPKLIEIINNNNFKNLNVFVDFKNSCNSLFVNDIVAEIAHETDIQHRIDSTIFQSTIFFSSEWKKFGKSKNLNTRIFFCTDEGKSYYHNNILKTYKEKRHVSKTDSPFYYEDLVKIRKINSNIAEKICNKIPNIYFFLLSQLESDFLSYYLIEKYYNTKDDLNIIVSNDKDLMQTLIFSNTYMINKKRGVINFLERNGVLHNYIGIDKKSIKSKNKFSEFCYNIKFENFPLIMAIVGDKADEIPGVNGIGPSKAIEMFSDTERVKKYIGPAKEVVHRILNGGKFFKDDLVDEKLPKYWDKSIENNDIVTTSFKLISFDILCRKLERSNSLSDIERLKYINNILNEEKYYDSKIFESVFSEIKDSKITESEICGIMI